MAITPKFHDTIIIPGSCANNAIEDYFYVDSVSEALGCKRYTANKSTLTVSRPQYQFAIDKVARVFVNIFKCFSYILIVPPIAFLIAKIIQRHNVQYSSNVDRTRNIWTNNTNSPSLPNHRDLQDPSLTTSFEDSFALLGKPPAHANIAVRRERLAELLESGRQLIKEPALGIKIPPKGAYGNYNDILFEWTRLFPDPIDSDIDIDALSNCNDIMNRRRDIVNPGQYTIDAETGLFVSNCLHYNASRRFGALHQSFCVNGNHFVSLFFDPVQKKYVLCDNMRTPKIITPPANTPFTLKSLISDNYSSVLLMQDTVILDIDDAHSILQPQNWKGLDWTMPKWKDNNCYLSVAWMIRAYTKKLSEAYFKSKNT